MTSQQKNSTQAQNEKSGLLKDQAGPGSGGQRSSMNARCEAADQHLEEKMTWLVNTIESEIIPRLMAAHPDAAEVQVAPENSIGEGDVCDFTEITLNNETVICRQHIESIRQRGVSLQSIYLNLLTPAARRLDAMWVADLCDFTQITVALWRIQQLMYDLSPAFMADSHLTGASYKRIMLTALPGSQHTLGILMVAEFFRRAGWHVWGEPIATRERMLESIAHESFDVVGVSIGSQAELAEMVRFIKDLRAASKNNAIQVMAGGPLLNRHPEFIDRLGADATAIDAEDAVRCAERLIGNEGLFNRERYAI